jgi:hypothetical protein
MENGESGAGFQCSACGKPECPVCHECDCHRRTRTERTAIAGRRVRDSGMLDHDDLISTGPL